jgi:hypothetical protein
VRTVATSANGEAHGVNIHTIDIDHGELVGAPLWLPGDAPASALRLSDTGQTAATTVYTSRPGTAPEQHLVTFGVLPIPPRPTARFEDIGSRMETLAGIATDGDQQWLTSFVATTLPGSEAERGTIVMRPITIDGASSGPAVRQLLPGAPVAGFTFNNQQSVAALAWDRDTAQWTVYVAHPGRRAGLRATPLLTSPSGGSDQTVAIGTTGDQNHLLALIPDSLADQSERAAKLFVIDDESLEIVGDPISIRGVPDHSSSAIISATGGAAWITTRDAPSAFGYVTYIELDAGVARIKDDPSYTAADAAPVVAAHDEFSEAAIAADTRLEIRTAGAGVRVRQEFTDPIGALSWHASALLVAEGGRFHRLNADDLSIESTVQLQRGRIDAIVAIPETAWDVDDADRDGLNKQQEAKLGSSVDHADSDADGLLDGVDPDVKSPNSILIVNPRIQLRADAAGYERRILRVDSEPQIKGRWSLTYDEAAAPWLHVGAKFGNFPRGVHLRLDPALLPRSNSSVVTLELRAVDSEDRELAGSPMQVLVQVIQADPPLRRIAWVLGDPNNRERMQHVTDILSGAPLHYSHDRSPSMVTLNENGVDVVVVDESAAAQSLVTRRSITEFVRSGGSLVFIRTSSETPLARPTAEWLRPFGISLTESDTMQRGAAPQMTHPLARWWSASWSNVPSRTYSVQSPPAAILAANGSESADTFASTSHYGLGRVAIFASPAPLLDSGDAQRRLLIALFSWLARASFSDDPGQRDSDGDDLPDWLEDLDRNMDHEPGETHWANADTDGDGIPDGAEDVNLNGVLDAGETSPLTPDSDGDGVWDGADATSIPPFEEPLIAAVYPDTAPAHGGRTIVIQGRNLRASQRVWFGDRLADGVRTVDANAMSVVVPPASQSQSLKVDIRVEDTATGLEHIAVNAFTYSEPAIVQLALHPVPEATGPEHGALTLRLSSRNKVAIGRVALTVKTSPPMALTWGKLEPGIAAIRHGRSVTGSAAPDGSLSIAIGASRHAQGMGEFVTIPWTYAGDLTKPVTVQMINARVTADNGYPLQVRAAESFGLR